MLLSYQSSTLMVASTIPSNGRYEIPLEIPKMFCLTKQTRTTQNKYIWIFQKCTKNSKISHK